MKTLPPLKHPTPVSEPEFLNHLDALGTTPYVRSLILGYYKNLKRLDHQTGPQLDVASFGYVPYFENTATSITDQALHLCTSSPRAIEKDEKNKKRLNILHALNERLAGNKMKEEHAEKIFHALKKYRAKQITRFMQKNSTARIGRAQLFRWQFVNFVDKIYTNKTRQDASAEFEALENELYFYNLSNLSEIKDPREKQFAFLKDKKSVFHELTHLMSMKTADHAQQRFLSPWVCSTAEGHEFFVNRMITCNTAFPTLDTPEDAQVADCYIQGVRLLNEIATDLVTSSMVNFRHTHAHSDVHAADYLNAPYWTSLVIAPRSHDDDFIFTQGDYLMIGHIHNLIFALHGKDDLIMDPQYIPVEKQLTKIGSFARTSRLSPDIRTLVDEKLKTAIGLKPEVAELNILNFEKFTLLVGLAYEEMCAAAQTPNYKQIHGEPSPIYGETVQLIQAAIIDAYHNAQAKKLLQTLKQIFENGTQKDIDNLFADLAQSAQDADGWIIKSTTHKIAGANGWVSRPSNCNLDIPRSKDFPCTVTQKSWAKYLEFLLEYCQGFSPATIQKNSFLQKEASSATAQMWALLGKQNFCSVQKLFEGKPLPPNAKKFYAVQGSALDKSQEK